jgi:hypothetical protein
MTEFSMGLTGDINDIMNAHTWHDGAERAHAA